MTIGEKMKALRKEKGFSQEKLAELADLSITTIKQCENDARKLRESTLDSIAAALGVGVDELREG